MTPLHIEIAKSILANQRDFSSDEFAPWVENRGLHQSAAAGSIHHLKSVGLVEKIGEKKCDYAKGRKLNVFRLIPGKEVEMQEMISKARKAPEKRTQRILPSNPEYLSMQCYERTQAWLDGITRTRLA